MIILKEVDEDDHDDDHDGGDDDKEIIIIIIRIGSDEVGNDDFGCRERVRLRERERERELGFEEARERETEHDDCCWVESWNKYIQCYIACHIFSLSLILEREREIEETLSLSPSFGGERNIIIKPLGPSFFIYQLGI